MCDGTYSAPANWVPSPEQCLESDCFFYPDGISLCRKDKHLSFKKTITKNTVLFRNEIDCDCTYVILSGLAVVYYYTETGEAVVCGIFGRGCTIGEIECFLSYKAPYMIKALTPMITCQLPNDYLLKCSEHDLPLIKKVLSASGNSMRVFVRHMWVMNAQRVEERVRRLLIVVANSGIETRDGVKTINLTHNDLAFLINTNRLSISRSLQKLAQEGFITKGRENIQIQDSPLIYPKEPNLFFDSTFVDQLQLS